MVDHSPLNDDRRERGQRLEAVARDRWRDRRGVSGLADAAGVSRATLYSWFRGDTTPDLDAAARLADALGMAPSELLAVLGGDEAPQEPGFAREQLFRADLDWDEGQGERLGESPILSRRAVYDPEGKAYAVRAIDPLAAARQLRRGEAWRRDLRSAAPHRPLLDVLLDQPVMTCQSDEPIGPVVQRMFERAYSQLPVYRGENLVGLLTGDTITRWYAASRDMGGTPSDDTPVSDVLGYAETGHPFELVGPETVVGHALLLFNQAMREGTPLTAILVTSDATAAGKPLGIVTTADLPRLGLFGRQ